MASEQENKDLTDDSNLAPKQVVENRRLSKLPILIGAGILSVVLIFMIAGISSKSHKQLTDEEKQALQLEKEKDQANSKQGMSENEIKQRSKTDISGTIIEEKKTAENTNTIAVPEVTVVETKSEERRDEELNQKIKELLEQNVSLQEQLVAMQKNRTTVNGKPGSANADENMKELKQMRREIATLKQQAFIKALTSSSSTHFTAPATDQTSLKPANMGGSKAMLTTSDIAREQQDLQRKMVQAQNQLDALRNNTGTQVISGGGLTPPPVGNNGSVVAGMPPRPEVNNNGSPATTGSPDAYSVFSHNGSWDLGNELTAPTSDFIMRAGMVIPATLISGAISDVQGQLMAQVSQNVYDTATGKYLLIPQGTRLIGTYQTGAIFGQERMLIAWQRLIYPDNKVLDLGSMPGADISGYSGFHDQVDNHWWKLLTSAFLLSGITATVSVATADDKNSSSNNSTSMNDEARVALANQVGSVVAQVIQRNLNVAPTLTIRPGYRFNVMITKDMTFGKPYKAFDYKL